MKKNLLVLYIFILVFQQSSYAANHYKENVYQTKWCDEMCGIKEYRLVDKTRIDCLTKTHAIEFDFAYKVYESIGQALYYSIQTQKKPGVVLIVEKPEKDKKIAIFYYKGPGQNALSAGGMEVVPSLLRNVIAVSM